MSVEWPRIKRLEEALRGAAHEIVQLHEDVLAREKRITELEEELQFFGENTVIRFKEGAG